jgi:hypothetical protein
MTKPKRSIGREILNGLRELRAAGAVRTNCDTVNDAVRLAPAEGAVDLERGRL